MRKHLPAFVLSLAILTTASARIRMLPLASGAAAGGVVPLPYIANDNSGNSWVLQQYGWLQQQGNQPIFQQIGVFEINGNQINANVNQARQDEKTGEIIIENISVNGLQCTRRVLFKMDENYVRIIDVFRNPQAQQQSINVGWMTSLNYGLQSAQMVTDPKSKNPIAWIATPPVNRTAVSIFGGKGSKTVPSMIWQQGNNQMQAQMQLTVPGNKQVAVMQIHLLTATPDSGTQFVMGMKESKLVADVPPEIRKLIINFNTGSSWIGDREVLRGDLLDIVELRGGDQLKGTLKEDRWQLETFYGNVELPADRVKALINVGQFRPRQLIVTGDGQIFGGKLSKETIALEMSSGQVIQVPLTQISRIGYRKQTGESDEIVAKIPLIALRSGDRVSVALPTNTIDVATCYGLLKLKPQSIAGALLQSSEHDVPEIQLTDGSRFAGILVANQFEMTLATSETKSNVTFPVAAISRMQFAAPSDDADDEDAPRLKLSNEDELAGTLSGDLKLDTAFDTITIKGDEIRSVSHAPDSGLDVQVTLWDQTTLSGQIEAPLITCALRSGLEVQVPVTLIDSYQNPQPAPSAMMLDRIRQIVKDLSADDWKQRDRAEQQLQSMGPSVVGVLKQMAPSQTPEAQQRIDTIVKQMEKSRRGSSSNTNPSANPAQMQGVLLQD
jgi:hypothetical protein